MPLDTSTIAAAGCAALALFVFFNPSFRVPAVVLAAAVGASMYSEIEPKPLRLPPLRELAAPTEDTLLGGPRFERLFKDELRGAESFVQCGDDDLCTGLADGRVVAIRGASGPAPRLDYLGQTGGTGRYGLRMSPRAECMTEEALEYLTMEASCGRPLGLRVLPGLSSPYGSLLIAEATRGVMEMDLAFPHATKMRVRREQHGLTLVNDLDVDLERGIAYFTNTGRHERREIHKTLLEAAPTGGLYRLDLRNNAVSEVAGGLVMPNGVQLTPDRKHALVVSTAHSRVDKIDVDTGEVARWATDLQGLPDNIRPAGARGTYLVGLGSKRALPFSLVQLLAPWPMLRDLVAWLPLSVTASLLPKYGLVAELGADGEVLQYLHDPSGAAHQLSGAEVHGGYLWLGSWKLPFVARTKCCGFGDDWAGLPEGATSASTTAAEEWLELTVEEND